MAVPRDSQRFTNEQLANARTIITVGRGVGASSRDIMIALMTGFQESGLRNLNWGDRDSIGVFQQRNAWGSRQDRLDVAKSARMFYMGGQQGQRGLLDFSHRDGMSLTRAAQSVQVSAFPNAYAKWEGRSRDLMSELSGSTDLPERASLVPSVDSSLAPSDGQTSALADMGDERLAQAASLPDDGMPMGLGAATAPGTETADRMPQFDMPTIPGLDELLTNDHVAANPGGGFELPTSYEAYSGPQGKYGLPGVKPWVQSAANEVGGKFGITSIGGVGERGRVSDHPGGLALDFMTKGATGNALAAYTMANAQRLGVKYIIWHQRIWSVGRASEGWRMMPDRGSPTENHMDHVHVSFVSKH